MSNTYLIGRQDKHACVSWPLIIKGTQAANHKLVKNVAFKLQRFNSRTAGCGSQ